MKNLLTAALILGTLVMLTLSCTGEDREGSTSEKRKAPAFEVVTIAGDTVSLEQSIANEKPTVVYFTASWCPVCAKNWPSLSEVYPEYRDRLNLIAIGIDPSDTREVMTELAEDKNFTFPTTWGHPQIMVDFEVPSQATTVGIDREGYIVFQKNKTAFTAEEFRGLFDQLVN